NPWLILLFSRTDPLSLGSAFLSRHFCAGLARLGKPDSYCLLAASYSFSTFAALQRASFPLFHGALNFLRRFLTVSRHCDTPSSSDCKTTARRGIVRKWLAILPTTLTIRSQ